MKNTNTCNNFLIALLITVETTSSFKLENQSIENGNRNYVDVFTLQKMATGIMLMSLLSRLVIVKFPHLDLLNKKGSQIMNHKSWHKYEVLYICRFLV